MALLQDSLKSKKIIQTSGFQKIPSPLPQMTFSLPSDDACQFSFKATEKLAQAVNEL